MNAQELLEQLLASGRQIADQGRDLASKGVEMAKEHIEIPEAGPERDKMIQNLGKGAAVGGLLALLVGTKTGRKILSPAIKLGSVAALGTVGYKVFNKWKEQQGITGEGTSIANLEGPAAKERSVAILRAMIGAAKADGTIDATEQATITEQIKASGLEASATELLMTEMQKPASAADIAALSDSPEMGVELYLASMVVSGEKNEQEQKYLSDLATNLKLDPKLVEDLRAEVRDV